MPDQTPILQLPYILPAQAQKHVTHNEALRLLDIIVQLGVIARDMGAPPATPVIGDRYIVESPASGAWGGQGRAITVFTATGWDFVMPRAGWQAFVQATAETVVFDGTDWIAAGVPTFFDKVGVNTSANTTNRLTVSAPATLLTHDGTDHQVKVNKATAADTASLLFQTGFAGRAEMGLAGNDDFGVKVSADGTTFHTAMTVARASGAVTLPNGVAVTSALDVTGALVATGGVTVDGTLQGTAVQATSDDSTTDRLMRVGAFGLGSGALIVNTDWSLIDVTGFYRATLATTPNLPTAIAGWQVMHIQGDATSGTQMAIRGGGDDIRFRRRSAGNWSAWVSIFHLGNIVGGVTQSGGLPTGAVVERGASANGEYTRFADGTLICYRTNLSATNASTALGSVFRSSANVTWTFPSPFIAAPKVQVDIDDADCWGTTAAAPTTASVALRAMAAVTKASALTMRAMAVGRWY